MIFFCSQLSSKSLFLKIFLLSSCLVQIAILTIMNSFIQVLILIVLFFQVTSFPLLCLLKYALKSVVFWGCIFYLQCFLFLSPLFDLFSLAFMCRACVHANVVSFGSDSLRPCGLQPARLLCPWDSPGQNTGVACHALLQGIFLTQGTFISCTAGRFFTTEPPGKPFM